MKNTTKNILKTIAWLVGTPVILVLLLFVAIYIPPIQRWAVNTAADYLGEEMEMEVKVGQVSLGFPFDLVMGNVTAKKTAGEVLNAEELKMELSILPLFSGELKVDNISLKNTKLNTRDLVEAMQLQGIIGMFKTNNTSLLFDKGQLTIPVVSLSNSDLEVTLADSVPEDTTTSEPGFLRTVIVNKAVMDNVKMRINLAPSADSVSVGTMLGKALIACRLDLENGNYSVHPLSINSSEFSYDKGKSEPLSGFDANHVRFSNVNLSIDSLSYQNTGNLFADIKQFSGADRCGFTLSNVSGICKMDKEHLWLEGFNVTTPHSEIDLALSMDLNAFDKQAPGQMGIEMRGFAGKADMMPFTAEMMGQFERSWPDEPLLVSLSAAGNMEQMEIKHVEAHLNGAFDISGDAQLNNILDPEGNIGIKSSLSISGQNLSFIKGFLPAETAKAFNLPKGLSISSNLTMDNKRLIADAILRRGKSTAKLKADYDLNREAYDIDLTARDFYVNAFVPLTDSCNITAHLKAKGQGFNFDSPYTYSDATLDMEHVDYGIYYLDSTNAKASLKKQVITANMDFKDERLDGQFLVDGTLNNKGVDAILTIDLPFSDLYALRLSDEPLTAHATHGEITAQSNFNELFLVDAAIEGVEIVLRNDSLTTEKFDLHAESTKDSTDITLQMSDMDFDFHAPSNLLALLDDFGKVAETAKEQVKNRALNIDKLKAIMPSATLNANIGNQNPLSKFIFTQGCRYKEVSANLRTSKEYGLQGNAYMHGFSADSLRIDTVFFDIYQDTTQLTYNLGITCPDQSLCSAFTAGLNGFVAPRIIDTHLTFFNAIGEQGIDLGLHGNITPDSLLHITLYPEKPVIAYHTFKLNEDNYIDIRKGNMIFADVLLESESDESSIYIGANPVDSQLQNIETIIKKLNIEELLTVVPFVPKMTGFLNLDANYVQTSAGFTVNGKVEANQFTYEGTGMGDLMTAFNYQPMGEDGHDINAMIFRNDQHIGVVKGTYNVEAPDYLNASVVINELPLSMANAFIPDNVFGFSGDINGIINVTGPTDTLLFTGLINPNDVHIYSDIYSFDLYLANEPIEFNDSYLTFNDIKIFGAGQNPLTVNGFVDFSDLNEISMNLSLYGQNFPVFDAPRTRKSALFGKLYGDFFARVNGTTNDMKIRGMVNVLNATDITYIMTNTPLTVDYRLDDIVTFVDFNAPEDQTQHEAHTFMGIDMQINLEIEDGVQVRCEFSADKQSYVNVQGGGSMTMSYSPEGVINLIGRYTVNEGEMKYTLPVIPLKTFTLQKGSYIEFTGRPMNPTMNITATEETKASVSNPDGSSRSVQFNVGLRITNSLENMGLEFTIEAPEDIAVQNELASMTAEEKNKLAVALLATGMYLSSTNQSGFSTTNALNNFLQNEINNIAGKAVSTAVKVDMSVGMEQTKRDDGTTRTDYSFKFTKRFFSDKLNVVVGGRINADGNNNSNESGAYIDDISLEWRLDNGGTQYIRLFHDKNYDNLVEGELTENGAGVVLRKKLDNLSELFIWKKNDKNK